VSFGDRVYSKQLLSVQCVCVCVCVCVCDCLLLVNGGWSLWSAWSPSCPTCGPGLTRRSRVCNNPVPMFGGLNCSENSTEEMNCATPYCPGVFSLFQVSSVFEIT